MQSCSCYLECMDLCISLPVMVVCVLGGGEAESRCQEKTRTRSRVATEGKPHSE